MYTHLLNRLRLPNKPVHITSHDFKSQVIVHVRESYKTAILNHYIDHLSPVHKPDVLVIPMRTYGLVLGLPWFITHKPEINWATGQSTSLRTPSGHGEPCRSGKIV